jgi:hypothetical protein
MTGSSAREAPAAAQALPPNPASRPNRCLVSTRPGQWVPGCLTGRIRLRSPVRCPVPGSAAAAVTGTM